ncbi:MAG: phosphatase PAP2 family protein [Prevotellaceae bacterium]|jgi:membrane-associated phospholipid phosphatase|nr:phosphatase PAP2 family protein [Prevotellaceae bacterium]
MESIVLPVSCIVLGGALSFTHVGSGIDDKVRDVIRYRNHKTALDDHLQYLPTVAIFGLSLTGLKARHDYVDRTIVTATGYLLMTSVVQIGKRTFRVMRPDGSKANSFPSGHTATAFLGAEFVREEYGSWWGVGAYTLAGLIALTRIYNDRHWASDVITGAGVGILSARASYWLLPYTRKLIRGEKAQLTALPFYTGKSGGVSLALRF